MDERTPYQRGFAAASHGKQYRCVPANDSSRNERLFARGWQAGAEARAAVQAQAARVDVPVVCHLPNDNPIPP